MGALSGIAKIASIAGPVLSVVYPPAGLAITAIGAVAGSIEAKKAGKAANNAAQQAVAAQQSEYEKAATRAAEVYQDDLERSQKAAETIKQNQQQVQARLAEARQIGDTIAAESYQRQLDQLSTRLAEENRIAQDTYDKGLTKLKDMEATGAKYYGEDLAASSKIRSQFEGANAQALGREVTNRGYEDKVQKQVTEQALQDAGLEGGTPRGLVAAQSEQDSEFAQIKQKAERAAAARGEDPRRAALAVEMQQARAAGSLSADYRKTRIQELQQIAAGNRLSSGATAASIAQQGLNAIPTEGREMAGYLDKQGVRQVNLQQNAGAAQGQRYTAGARDLSGLTAGYDAGRQTRAVGYIEGMSEAETAALDQEMQRQDKLGTSQRDYMRALNGVSGQVGDMYGDAAKANQQAAADAKAAGAKSLESLVQAGVQFGGTKTARPTGAEETYGSRIGSQVSNWLKPKPTKYPPKSAEPVRTDFTPIKPKTMPRDLEYA